MATYPSPYSYLRATAAQNGYSPTWVDLELTNFSATQDANSLVDTDFADAGSGRITITIDGDGSARDGFTEGVVKAVALSDLASDVGITAADITGGDYYLGVRITFNAALPRYTSIGFAIVDSATQTGMDGVGVGAFRNALADNVQPQITNDTFDQVPPGGAVARTADTTVYGVIRTDSSAAEPMEGVAFVADADQIYGVVADKGGSSTYTHGALFVTTNNSSAGVNLAIDVNIQIAAIPAGNWPFNLSA